MLVLGTAQISIFRKNNVNATFFSTLSLPPETSRAKKRFFNLFLCCWHLPQPPPTSHKHTHTHTHTHTFKVENRFTSLIHVQRIGRASIIGMEPGLSILPKLISIHTQTHTDTHKRQQQQREREKEKYKAANYAVNRAKWSPHKSYHDTIHI